MSDQPSRLKIEERLSMLSSEILGDGGNGIVINGKYQNQPCAIKIIKQHDIDKNRLGIDFQRQKTLLQQLNHKYIVNVYEIKKKKKQNIWQIYQQKCDYTLQNYILQKNQNIDISTRIKFAIQLICGIAYLRLRRVLFRDLKPKNIMIKKDKTGLLIKIIDFGVARQFINYRATLQSKGTFGYMSPEVYNQEQYTLDSDLWSLGVVLLQLFEGSPVGNSQKHPRISRWPFLKKIQQLINHKQFYSQKIKKPLILNKKLVPQPFLDIIDGLLQQDKNKRMKFQQVTRILKQKLKQLQSYFQSQSIIKQINENIVQAHRSQQILQTNLKRQNELKQYFKKVFERTYLPIRNLLKIVKNKDTIKDMIKILIHLQIIKVGILDQLKKEYLWKQIDIKYLMSQEERGKDHAEYVQGLENYLKQDFQICKQDYIINPQQIFSQCQKGVTIHNIQEIIHNAFK